MALTILIELYKAQSACDRQSMAAKGAGQALRQSMHGLKGGPLAHQGGPQQWQHQSQEVLQVVSSKASVSSCCACQRIKTALQPLLHCNHFLAHLHPAQAKASELVPSLQYTVCCEQ